MTADFENGAQKFMDVFIRFVFEVANTSQVEDQRAYLGVVRIGKGTPDTEGIKDDLNNLVVSVDALRVKSKNLVKFIHLLSETLCEKGRPRIADIRRG